MEINSLVTKKWKLLREVEAGQQFVRQKNN
jgi:hypothetical protein